MTMDLYLKSSDTIFLTLFEIEMFISCTRVLMGLQWCLVMSSSRLDSTPAARSLETMAALGGSC
jgi:hypothetical protein